MKSVNVPAGNNIWFRNVVDGAEEVGKKFGFDGIIVEATPVPEPVNMALALFGALALGTTAGYRFLGRRRIQKG